MLFATSLRNIPCYIHIFIELCPGVLDVLRKMYGHEISVYFSSLIASDFPRTLYKATNIYKASQQLPIFYLYLSHRVPDWTSCALTVDTQVTMDPVFPGVRLSSNESLSCPWPLLRQDKKVTLSNIEW